MKSRKLSSAAFAVVAVAVLLGPPTAAAASAGNAPSPAPEEKQFLPTSEPADLSTDEAAHLADYGLEGAVTVQTDEQGAHFYLDGDGDWYFTTPSEAGEGEISPMWSATFCTGSFFGPQKVGSYLEWGGQNSCGSSSPNGVYPHYLDTMLRDTCQGNLCWIVDNLWIVRSNNNWYGTVATVADSRYCAASDDRRYSIVAWPTVKGTKYGPFVSGSTAISGCHVHPAAGGV